MATLIHPTGEEKVTELIRDKVSEGKSAIGFDNLYYLTEAEPYDFIKRVIVKRMAPRTLSVL